MGSMQPLKKRVQSLRSDVMRAKQALQFDVLAEELAVLEEQLNQPEIWNNPDHAQSVAKKAAALRQTVQPWQVLGVQLDDLLELMELGDDDLLDEFIKQIDALETEFSARKTDLLFSGNMMVVRRWFVFRQVLVAWMLKILRRCWSGCICGGRNDLA